MTRSGGVASSYGYDNAGRVTNIAHAGKSTFSYSYDSGGNLGSKTETQNGATTITSGTGLVNINSGATGSPITLTNNNDFRGPVRLTTVTAAGNIAITDINARKQAEMLLSEARQNVGLSQSEVAKTLGIKQPSLSKLEKQTDMQLSTLGRILLRQNRTLEALTVTQRAMEMLANGLASQEEGEALIRLSFAEAIHAAKEHRGARDAIAEAREYIHSAVARIQDPLVRQSFLSQVPENARTLSLALEWLGA